MLIRLTIACRRASSKEGDGVWANLRRSSNLQWRPCDPLIVADPANIPFTQVIITRNNILRGTHVLI